MIDEFWGDTSPETARFLYEQAQWLLDHPPAEPTVAEQRLLSRCRETIAAYRLRFPTEAETAASKQRRKLEVLEAAQAGAEYVMRNCLDYLQQEELHLIERKTMIGWMKRWLETYRSVDDAAR